jgi:ABC-type taurine transport system ATPase subunit
MRPRNGSRKTVLCLRVPACSNENLLVCAPTGAGKTNIAMITVLREVAANMAHGVIQRAAFKVGGPSTVAQSTSFGRSAHIVWRLGARGCLGA